MSDSILRVGVIGCGYWGPNLVRNFFGNEGSTVTVVSDLKEENLQRIQATYPTIRTTTDAQDLIDDPMVDAVAVATPLESHFAIAKAAIEAGKHVLVEKPMTETSGQAQELIALARDNDVILMVDHTFVFTGAVEKIKELIDSGELGDLHYYDSTRINLGLLQQNTNVLWDLVPHDLSILAYLIESRPLSVQALGYKHIGTKQEEIATVHITYPNGFHAHIRTSWLSPVKMRLTLIGGSKKMIVYNDVEPSEKVRVYDKGIDLKEAEVTAFTPLYRAGDILIPELDRTEALKTETRHFVSCIRDRVKPRTSGEVGLSVVRILEAAQASLAQHGASVPLPQ